MKSTLLTIAVGGVGAEVGHDPGGNQCPVFYETRGRPKTTRGGRGIQTQPFLVYTQPKVQGMYSCF